MEVEWVVDYHGSEPVCACEDQQLKRITIRFLLRPTRFRPPVCHSRDPCRCEREWTIEPFRRNEEHSQE